MTTVLIRASDEKLAKHPLDAVETSPSHRAALNIAQKLSYDDVSRLELEIRTSLHIPIEGAQRSTSQPLEVNIKEEDAAGASFSCFQAINVTHAGMMVASVPWTKLFITMANVVQTVNIAEEQLFAPSLAPLLRAIASPHHLTDLRIESCMLTNDLCGVVASGLSSSSSSSLTSIRLPNNAIGSDGLARLAAQLDQLPRLRELVLDGNPVGTLGNGDDDASAEAAASRSLFADTPGYDPRGLKCLADMLPRLASISLVSLCSCSLGTSGGALGGADRGGVTELCIASRRCQLLSKGDRLVLKGNNFSERTKKSLHVASGLTCVL